MNTTRRHPRTLEEAFGPYTSHHISVQREPVSISDKAAGVLLAIAGAAVLAVLLFVDLSS
jgi:hypothetical protein